MAEEKIPVFIGLPPPPFGKGRYSFYIPDVRESTYRGHRYLWPKRGEYLNCVKSTRNYNGKEIEGTTCYVEPGRVFVAEVSYDSRKHVRDYHYMVLRAEPGVPLHDEKVVLVKYDFSGGEDTVPIENARLIADFRIVDDEKLAESYVKAGYTLAKSSDYKKFLNLVAWLIKKLKQEEQSRPSIRPRGEIQNVYIPVKRIVVTSQNAETIQKLLIDAIKKGFIEIGPGNILYIDKSIIPELVRHGAVPVPVAEAGRGGVAESPASPRPSREAASPRPA